MSIRTKLLLALAVGVLVALAGTFLSYTQASEFSAELEQILNEDLAVLRSVSEAREAVRDAGKVEDLMTSVEDSSLQQSIARSMGVLNSSLQVLRRLGPDTTAYDSLRRDGAAYGTASDDLVQSLRDSGTTLRSRLAELRRNLRAFDADLEALKRSLTEVPDPAPGALPPLPPPVDGEAPVAERPATKKGALTKVQRKALLAVVDQIRTATQELIGVEVDLAALLSTGARVDEQINERLKVWEETVVKLVDEPTAERFKEHIDKLEGARPHVVGLTDVLVSEVRKATGEVRNKLATTRRIRGRIDSDLGELSQKAFRALDYRRATIDELRAGSLRMLLFVIIIGVLAASLLGAVLARGVTRGLRALVTAARHIEEGRFDTRVSIESRDELADLADAFNAMAALYGERRKQQLNYNEIVSALNSTYLLHEIVRGSVQQIVQRAECEVGSLYLMDESGEQLVLSHGIGLSHEAMVRRSFRLGQGLVGRAGELSERIIIHGDEHEPFYIDTGVGRVAPAVVVALPVVHHEQLLGVFVLASTRQLSDSTMAFVEESVVQVGVAINNARAVETIRETAEALRGKTEQLIAQQSRMEKAHAELERASRLKTDFLATMSHELRTPLNSIIGFTELVLERQTDLRGKPKRHLEIVLKNARNLLALINDLLDITKIESRAVTIICVETDMSALVEESLQVVSPMVKGQVELSKSVPKGFSAWTDPSRLRQVLLNLLSNAAKFTDQGQIQVTVTPDGDEWFTIAVADTGIGIHGEDLARIFDKFHQVDGSSSRKYGGTGLGLAITHELVKLLGGSIEVASQPDEGSIFVVRLPRDGRVHLAAQAAQDGIITAPELAPTQVPMRAPGAGRAAGAAAQSSKVGKASGVFDPPPVAVASATAGQAPPSGEGERAGPLAVVLDARPEALVAVRESLKSVGFVVRASFAFSDALKLFEEESPAALFIGEALPEDQSEVAHRRLGRLLRERSIPLFVLGDPGIYNRFADIAPMDYIAGPVTTEAIQSMVSSLAEAGRLPSPSSAAL